MLEQGVWRGMPYFDVLWRKRHLTIREMHLIYANYYSCVFWFLMISLVVLLDLHGFAERVSATAVVVYTVSLGVVAFSLYILATWVGIKLSQKYSSFFMIYPLVGFTAITIATYIVELGMSSYFSGVMSLEHAAEKLPINIILTLLLETFFITFVLPVAINASNLDDKKREKRAADAEAENACVTLTVAGEVFFCNHLISISSQDHYVRIQTKDGEKLMRARLSDLIGQLACQKGIQPHRSHWVSRDAVASMVSRKGHKFLELRNGSTVPVARGRVVDVQEWLEI